MTMPEGEGKTGAGAKRPTRVLLQIFADGDLSTEAMIKRRAKQKGLQPGTKRWFCYVCGTLARLKKHGLFEGQMGKTAPREARRLD